MFVHGGAPVDVSAFRLYASGKVNGDTDMVFYGQTANDDRTVIYASIQHLLVNGLNQRRLFHHRHHRHPLSYHQSE